MNIIVKPYGSDLCYCRPDTTWERENRDFYSPECVNKVLWAPVIFIRISKAGKCIGAKFASRYYDAVSCGMLMYGDIPCSGNESQTAAGSQICSCIDHTSILPSPMYEPVVLDDEKVLEVDFSCHWGNMQHAKYILNGAKGRLEDALCKASQLTSLRIGDYVAVELAPLAILTDKKDGDVAVQGTFCGNEIFGFKIIF